MKHATAMHLPIDEHEENKVASSAPKPLGIFNRFLELLMRPRKNDFTFEDWQRLEFRQTPDLRPLRNVINHDQWRI